MIVYVELSCRLNQGEIVRVSGNAVGLTENGLVKIKRTDNDRYAFAR